MPDTFAAQHSSFSMTKKLSLYCAALSLLAVSCNKESVAPTPESTTDGIPADIAAVLKKHHCNYRAAPTLSSQQNGHKSAFSNARELDSVLTNFENQIRTMRLVPLTNSSKSANRIESGVGSQSFKVEPGPGIATTAYEEWTNLRANIVYQYCTGDGLLRRSDVTDVVLSTSGQPNTTLTYANSYKFSTTYDSKVDFEFGGLLTFNLYGSYSVPITTTWTVDFKGTVYPGGLVRDNDQCGDEPAPPPQTIGIGGGTGNGGTGSGGTGTGSGGTGSGGTDTDGGYFPGQGTPSGGGTGGPPTFPGTAPDTHDPPPPSPGPKEDTPVARN